jgi:hypothetical protein
MTETCKCNCETCANAISVLYPCEEFREKDNAECALAYCAIELNKWKVKAEEYRNDLLSSECTWRFNRPDLHQLKCDGCNVAEDGIYCAEVIGVVDGNE